MACSHTARGSSTPRWRTLLGGREREQDGEKPVRGEGLCVLAQGSQGRAEGQEMGREREGRGKARQLTGTSCSPFLAQQLELALALGGGLTQGEAPRKGGEP